MPCFIYSISIVATRCAYMHILNYNQITLNEQARAKLALRQQLTEINKVSNIHSYNKNGEIVQSRTK